MHGQQKLHQPILKADGNDVAIEQFDLAHEGFTIQNEYSMDLSYPQTGFHFSVVFELFPQLPNDISFQEVSGLNCRSGNWSLIMKVAKTA